MSVCPKIPKNLLFQMQLVSLRLKGQSLQENWLTKLLYFNRKQAEIDRKKAEVRARLEAQAAGKKAKKGFMTPERKKKLRVSKFKDKNASHEEKLFCL